MFKAIKASGILNGEVPGPGAFTTASQRGNGCGRHERIEDCGGAFFFGGIRSMVFFDDCVYTT